MVSDEFMVIDVDLHRDQRGSFTKVLSQGIYDRLDEPVEIVEIFSTVSRKYALRGMHFQKEPFGIGKFVWVTNGSTLDVVIDLRGGDNCGKVHEINLSGEEGKIIWVPRHFAHGFLALSDLAIVNYATTGAYVPSHDSGIKWNSFGYSWPHAPEVLSERDSSFLDFEQWKESD
jgi:dTDP-4-dehydrorhamnose 3,5-epimerase/CDP-3, 6-dideoxy-D-glycero-D-glycero-4-hexulose-5-epimerase